MVWMEVSLYGWPSVWLIRIQLFCLCWIWYRFTSLAESKPVKQEVSSTVILPGHRRATPYLVSLWWRAIASLRDADGGDSEPADDPPSPNSRSFSIGLTGSASPRLTWRRRLSAEDVEFTRGSAEETLSSEFFRFRFRLDLSAPPRAPPFELLCSDTPESAVS